MTGTQALPPTGGRRRERRSPWAIVLAVLGGLTAIGALGVIAILVALTIALSSFEGCEVSTGGGGGSSGIDVGPGQGTASQRLDVEVEPRTDLTDGQVAYVTSDAFKADRVVGVTVCLREADTEAKGLDACDSVNGARFATDPSGRLHAALAMPRVITVQGAAYDCATDVERCIVVAASSSNFDVSGGQPISFRPDLGPADLVPASPRPRTRFLPVTASPPGPYAAGDTIEATVTGLAPGEPVLVAPCTERFLSSEPQDACEPDNASDAFGALLGLLGDVEEHADELGSFTARVTLPTTVVPFSSAPDGSASCTVEGACAIVIAAAADLTRSAYLPFTVTG